MVIWKISFTHLKFHSDDSINSKCLEVWPEVEVVHDWADEYRESDIVPGEGLAIGGDRNDLILCFVDNILGQVGK